MAPVGLRFRAGKGWQVVHRCLCCDVVRPNRIAVDAAQPDDVDAVARLAGLPVPDW